MRLAWFQDQDNIAYCDINEFAENFGNETGITGLREKIEAFKENPVKEGITYVGNKRTSVKLFIPDMYFEGRSNLDMGDTVWVFMGEMYPAYCLYWPQVSEE